MKGKSGYLKWGLTIFLTVCAILVFYDTFYMSGAGGPGDGLSAGPHRQLV